MAVTAINQDLYYFMRLKSGDENAFDYLFNYYYPGLVVYADKFVTNNHLAEEIVQGVFLKIWQDRRFIEINNSFKSYVFQSVKNRCLDVIKHRKVKDEYSQKILAETENSRDETWETYVESELYALLITSIDKLPVECRKVIHLSRIKNLNNKEIAEKLGISVKTVENQITKALKYLRVELKDYL
ncbi:MAG: RNA polymerase sigma-70 factor [Bacteroidales bacterium]|nr:RNA polymerase sigma-70 factor [Bacteroidales bacterium]